MSAYCENTALIDFKRSQFPVMAHYEPESSALWMCIPSIWHRIIILQSTGNLNFFFKRVNNTARIILLAAHATLLSTK